MTIPFLDLRPEFEAVAPEWFDALRRIGANGRFVEGSEVAAFESEFATFVDSAGAVSVASGTDALILALEAQAIGPGDEVITPAYSFFATAEAIARVGAKPVFADIDPRTFCLDPVQVDSRLSDRTRAILPVHLFGCPADMTALVSIAQRQGLAVVEDCAQACGARHASRRVGSWGTLGCFSFYPTKVLGCFGDGGLVTLQHEDHGARLRSLGNHGSGPGLVHETIGYNSRLDEIQAALLRIKLGRLGDAISARQRVAQWYNERFEGTGIRTPEMPADAEHVFNLYTIRTTQRDRVAQRLAEAGIGFARHYRVPLHLQPAFECLGYAEGDLPETEAAARDSLSLPIYPSMTEDQVGRVSDAVLGR